MPVEPTIRWSRPVVGRRAFLAGCGALATAAVLPGCTTTQEGGLPVSSTPATASAPPVVRFPPPSPGSVPLDTALQRRRSTRAFTPTPLTEAEIGQLLWAAQGVTADWGGRTAPSAGGLFPLELHAVTADRHLHYVPDGHHGEVLGQSDLRRGLMAAALDQEAVGAAPLVVAVIGVPSRTASRYGDRSSRYVDLEAGHAAQNLLLEAVALGLAAVPIGAFDDDAVARVLGLPVGHEPRYLIPVGHPA